MQAVIACYSNLCLYLIIVNTSKQANSMLKIMVIGVTSNTKYPAGIKKPAVPKDIVKNNSPNTNESKHRNLWYSCKK